MSFTHFNFNKQLLKNINQQGYHKPTPIQEQSIQLIREGHDILGLAQTGTGKTAAFTLPILHNLSQLQLRRVPTVLILSPTRELAEQTHGYIKKFASGINVRSIALYGGVSREAQVRKLQSGVDIVVACPGRLLDLAMSKAIDLSHIETLVLDEVDQMLDQGFFPDINRILKHLPSDRQNLVFSATMPQEVRRLVKNVLRNPIEVTAQHTQPVSQISHMVYQTDRQNKNQLLVSILQTARPDSTIVFTKTKHKARSLAHQLSRKGFNATSLQGNLSQQKRLQALDGFKRGTFDILVATDIAARGIDVQGISHVINYDMPATIELYTHRSGRTGRASNLGEALTFATPEDAAMLKNMMKTLRNKLIFRQSPSSTVTEQTKLGTDKKITSSKSSKTPARSRGKRSSQRNTRKRAVSFDFGI